MGSKEIWELDYHQAFALIAVFGRATKGIEKRAKNRKDTVDVTQIFHIGTDFTVTDAGETFKENFEKKNGDPTELIEGIQKVTVDKD